MSRSVRLILKAIVIFGITLVLGKVVLRLVYDKFNREYKLTFKVTDQGYRLGHSELSGRSTKNTGDFDVTVKINNNGFRDSKALMDSNIADWFLAGDSFLHRQQIRFQFLVCKLRAFLHFLNECRLL